MTKIYTILDTRKNEIFERTEIEIEDKCSGYSFYDDNDYKESYNNALNDYEDEEEKKEFIEYWQNRTIYETKEEFLKEMIENSTWCSPKGVMSEYKVLEIKEA